MEITYFIIFIIMLLFYIIYYLKLNHKIMEKIKNNDIKKFEVFASTNSLLFDISTLIVQLFNYVFLFVFLNKYGGDWIYMIPIGILCIIFLIFFTFTGFKKKKIILSKYKNQYGLELNYRQLDYISLFRHTFIIVMTILVLNLIAMFL